MTRGLDISCQVRRAPLRMRRLEIFRQVRVDHRISSDEAVGRRAHELVDQRPQKACVVYRAGGSGHRLLARLLRGDHHRAQTHARWLDSLSLGGSALPSAVAYWRSLLGPGPSSFLSSFLTSVPPSSLPNRPCFLREWRRPVTEGCTRERQRTYEGRAGFSTGPPVPPTHRGALRPTTP